MRLIDADLFYKLVSGFRDTAPEKLQKRKFVCNAILLALIDERETPTVDAAPVVRCKDCKNLCALPEYKHYAGECSVTRIKVTEDFYCAFGSRRVENAAD